MKRILSIIILSSLIPAPLFAAKPLPPLQISITPAQAGMSPADIKPGDVVEFIVKARPQIDAQEMKISIEISGGAELVSGEMTWSGAVVKGEEKTLTFAVRAPLKGKGKIKARVSLPGVKGAAAFSAAAQYILGTEPNKKPEPKPPVKKDRKGRDIIEYR